MLIYAECCIGIVYVLTFITKHSWK